MALLDRVLGTPFVYNHVRPLVVGGIDMSPVYDRVEAGADDVVLDVGCGTGDAMNYLRSFGRYVGVDTDPVAIDFAKKRWADRPNVEFRCKLLDASDVEAIAPSRVTLVGLLHHLDDAQVVQLFTMLRASPRLQRVVSLDIVFLHNERINNVLASLDRGQFCREQEGYERLVAQGGLVHRESVVVSSHPTKGRVKYFVMKMDPVP